MYTNINYTYEDAGDRVLWTLKTRVVNPKWLGKGEKKTLGL